MEARCTCFDDGFHESSSTAATKLELGMFPKSNSYETFRITSILNIIILSSRSRSSKCRRLETEAVEGVDDDARMPDRPPARLSDVSWPRVSCLPTATTPPRPFSRFPPPLPPQ